MSASCLEKSSQATNTWAQISTRRSVRGRLNTVQPLIVSENVQNLSCLSRLEMSVSLNSTSEYSFIHSKRERVADKKKEWICRRRNHLDVVFSTRHFCRDPRGQHVLHCHYSPVFSSVFARLVSASSLLSQPTIIMFSVDVYLFIRTIFCGRKWSRARCRETNPERQLKQHQLLITGA